MFHTYVIKLFWVSAFLLQTISSYGYANRKVVLLVGKATQMDTIGYNIVSDLSQCIHEGIKNNSIKLWDSPEKKYLLGREALSGLENSSGSKFSEIANLFIYEKWTAWRKSFEFSIEGFSFAGENEKGEEVLFGFLEMNEKIQAQFEMYELNVNANGIYGMTLWQALMNKTYDFEIIYFEGETIRELSRSYELKMHAFAAKRKLKNAVTIPERKLVVYSIETGPSYLSKHSMEFITLLEKFFNLHQQEFFNHGGDRILSYLKRSPVIISRVYVVEEWEKKGNTIIHRPIAIMPVVLGETMDSISIEKIEAWGLTISGGPIGNWLKDKSFFYVIKTVNGTELPSQLAAQYREALLNKKWNHLVKYQKNN